MENETPLRQAEPLAALSIEFVAKPEEVCCLRTAIPAAVRRGLGQAQGFAGCMVMISDREARLVNVITFWTGEGQMTNGSKRTRWLHRLLAPYVDHCLRVRTLDAYLTTLGSGHAPSVNTCSEKAHSLCVV
jgi:hypothetical protein